MTQQLQPGGMCPAITSVRCKMERVAFPKDEDQCYLAKKAAFAIWAPKAGINKNGAAFSLKQAVMSGLIRVEERIHDWLWQYKAEVVFFMRGYNVPLPMLANSEARRTKYAGNLPHSESPFSHLTNADKSKFGVTGIRRPDIILVKNKQLRWPGREGQYFDGSVHPDNLKMLIEVKFPGDTLKKGQEIDYEIIATQARFGVFVVEDNRDSKEWETLSAEAKAAERENIKQHLSQFSRSIIPPAIEGLASSLPVPIPGYTGIEQLLLKNIPLVSERQWQYEPIFSLWLAVRHTAIPAMIALSSEKEPSFLERVEQYYDQSARFVSESVTYAKNAIVRSWEWTWDLTASGFNYLSDKTRAALAACGAWFRESGQWIADEIIDPVTKKLSYAIHWVSEKTGEIVRLTEAKIKEAVETVYKYTDLTIDALKQVDWYQIAADLGNGTIQLMVKIGEEIIIIIEKIIVVAAIVLLAGLIIWVGGIVGGAASAVWATLAAAVTGITALTAATAS
ncbi:VRR-NUC domain-containing protein [Xenorhabdus indica]|uniref:VRR-NUC domain-containing protein n=1 Tax=Xenorhabdus indica TaxID=333964 RepID=UPI0016570F9F|nr:VRR-NUC domain-containing protein [Xenorhabdus indica]MBC8946562.1 hypothetical protein [Xenorhabdus indica]